MTKDFVCNQPEVSTSPAGCGDVPSERMDSKDSKAESGRGLLTGDEVDEMSFTALANAGLGYDMPNHNIQDGNNNSIFGNPISMGDGQFNGDITTPQLQTPLPEGDYAMLDPAVQLDLRNALQAGLLHQNGQVSPNQQMVPNGLNMPHGNNNMNILNNVEPMLVDPMVLPPLDLSQMNNASFMSLPTNPSMLSINPETGLPMEIQGVQQQQQQMPNNGAGVSTMGNMNGMLHLGSVPGAPQGVQSIEELNAHLYSMSNMLAMESLRINGAINSMQYQQQVAAANQYQQQQYFNPQAHAAPFAYVNGQPMVPGNLKPNDVTRLVGWPE